MSNTTDSNEFERFALSEGSSLVSGPTVENAIYMRVSDHERIMARAPLAAVGGDVTDALKLISTMLHEQLHDERQPVSACLKFPCDKINAVLAAAASSAPAEPPPFEDMTMEIAPAEPLQPEGEQVMNFSELCHIEHSPPPTPSAAAMRAAAAAAEEIAAWIFRLEQPLTSETDLRVAQDIVAAIITRHFPAASTQSNYIHLPQFPMNGTELECDGKELRPDGTCARCERINERIEAKIAAATTSPETPVGHAAGDDEGEPQ